MKNCILKGINNYYYKLHNTEILTNMSLSKNLAQYKNQTINLCSMDYSSLLELSNQSKPEKVSEAFLKTTCFFNFYLLGLFDRYNMTSLANYQFVDTVNGNTVSVNNPAEMMIHRIQLFEFLGGMGRGILVQSA